MKFAVIPWAKKYYNNELFNVTSSTNQNGLAEPYAEMKTHLEKLGHEINTIDLYDNLAEVNYFLFFDWFPEWIYKLYTLGLADRMVYCNAEPPTVRELNSPKGYMKVKKYFPYIMTWNKDLVDNQRIFYRTIPYNFVNHRTNIPYNEKKLLTSISANKKSNYKDELYTEREKLISYFEKEIPDQFDMYGVGWDKEVHSSYKGSPKSKFEVYSGYKFALALENTENVKGYVTEKIFDCLTSGIVPIYLGADDICDYVDEECFIDYRKFESPKELLSFLYSISEDRYQEYIVAANVNIEKLKSKKIFSGFMYAQNILDLATLAENRDFKIDVISISILRLKNKIVQIKCWLRRIVKKM